MEVHPRIQKAREGALSAKIQAIIDKMFEISDGIAVLERYYDDVHGELWKLLEDSKKRGIIKDAYLTCYRCEEQIFPEMNCKCAKEEN